MKKYISPLIIAAVFIIISGFQFYRNYQFRIKPPSKEWSKGVIISHGKVSSTPKLLNFNGCYIIAHDDGDKIKIIETDQMGKKLREKIFPGGDKFINDVNLLTDGKYIYLNWIYFKNSLNNIMELKLDKDFNVIDTRETRDVTESIQIGDNIMVVADNKGIQFIDYKNNKKGYINGKLPTKLAGTITKDGCLVTYYNSTDFKFFTVKDGVLSKPKTILRRVKSSRETFYNTAVACDDKYGYLIVERKMSRDFGQNILITFPVDGGKPNMAYEWWYGKKRYYDAGNGIEKNLRIFPNDQFTYSPVSVSSGDSARFVIGYARAYGKSQRQFDLLDYSVKDGKTVSSAFIDKTKEGSTMAWISGDTAVYCNQADIDEYDICIASRDAAFKARNNNVRPSEIRLALLDTAGDIANSIFGLFTMGIRWILPCLFLISLVTLFSYKLSLMKKKIAYITICIIAVLLKIYSAKSLFYGGFSHGYPEILRPAANGITLCIILSALAYFFGYGKYRRDSEINPDVLPILSFVLALLVDGILTQYIYSPFII